MHVNDGSYLSHTQGKKHQQNLARRAAKEAKDASRDAATQMRFVGHSQTPVTVRKNVLKIGRPGYRITKVRDPATKAVGLNFQLKYPEIATNVKPRYRFMSAFEQKKEMPDKSLQYLLIAAEPYETVGFRVQVREIQRDSLWTYWDMDSKTYTIQFLFKST